MTDILKEKAAKFLHTPKPDTDRISKIKKMDKPGPGTYKVTESMERSA